MRLPLMVQNPQSQMMNLPPKMKHQKRKSKLKLKLKMLKLKLKLRLLKLKLKLTLKMLRINQGHQTILRIHQQRH